MSRSGLIALIIIVVLTVAGGIYWYIEFVPHSDIANERSVEQPASPQPGSLQPASPQPASLPVEPPTSAPRGEQRAKKLTTESSPPVQQVITAEPAASAEQIIGPTEAPRIEEKEVEVTIIPIDELEQFFKTGLFAHGEPVLEPLEVLTQVIEEDEQPPTPIIWEEQEPAFSEEDPVVVGHQEAPAAVKTPGDEKPVSVATHIPTPRAEEMEFIPQWDLQLSLGIPHWELFSFTNNGFGMDVQFLRHSSDRFSFGGGLGARSTGGVWNLDLLGAVKWTFTLMEGLYLPVTVMAGPSLHLDTPVQFGLIGRAAFGLSYQLLERLSISLEGAFLLSWNVGQTVGVALEAPRIGFTILF